MGRPAPLRAEPLLQHVGRGRPLDLGRGRGDPDGAPRHPERLARPRALGDRPRPHRHGLALAAGRDPAKDGAHLQLADRLHGPLSRVPVRVLAGPAVRLGPHAEPRPVRAHPRAMPRRAVGAGRRYVGRARLQPAVRRVARAPVPARPAVLRARARPPLPRVLEPGRVRLQRPAPSDHARRGDRALPHAEALVEPIQLAAAPHVHVAGDRRLARCSPTSRPPTPTTRRPRSRSCAGARATTRITTARGAACSCSATATAAAGRRRTMLETLRRVRDLQGVPRTSMASSDEFFAALEAGAGELPDHRRRALLRVPPRHVHDSGRGQARQPARASGPCTTPIPGRARRTRGRRRASERAAGRAVAAPAPEPVPRHPAGVEHRARLRGRGPRPCRGARRGGRGRGRRAGGARR